MDGTEPLTLTDATGNIVGTAIASGSAGQDQVTMGASAICIVNGCTDPTADNYDPAANTDDGSCTYACAGTFAHLTTQRLQQELTIVHSK